MSISDSYDARSTTSLSLSWMQLGPSVILDAAGVGVGRAAG